MAAYTGRNILLAVDNTAVGAFTTFTIWMAHASLVARLMSGTA